VQKITTGEGLIQLKRISTSKEVESSAYRTDTTS